jgi:hypothetical protein
MMKLNEAGSSADSSDKPSQTSELLPPLLCPLPSCLPLLEK